MAIKKKPFSVREKGFFALSYSDSNQDKQNQNLLCYHYTIRQSLSFTGHCPKKRNKDTASFFNCKRKTVYFAISR